MVNPTGYTALDMIGFTDKGAYSSSDNYVKNDLVHYSGNIWRCLIDDTTGIAPAEGVNWTLFIGEPTNLVERIIAPVETDPATNSWAVGRQIIYNDNLYEVIAAITAGDALVAYEDDPTNANIKLADPVETQLLNEITTRQTGDTELRNALTNPNLLDNPWFTVNQRGQSSYDGSSGSIYMVDRWKVRYCSASVSSDGLTITKDGTEGYTNFGNVSQYFLIDDIQNLLGRQVTLTVEISDFNVSNGILIIALYNPSNTVTDNTPISRIDIAGNGIHTLTVTIPASLTHNYLDITIGFLGGSSEVITGSYKIKAVKLELGSVSTLAQDTAPNYAIELAKCQRYYIKLDTSLNSSGLYAVLGFGHVQTATREWVTIPLPTTMRTKPTISYNLDTNKIRFVQGGIDATSGIPITNIGVDVISQNIVKINCNNDSQSSVAVGAWGVLWIANSNDAYIAFSADL